MTIRKLLHSCILIEEDDYRILIDPGAYSFIEGRLKPDEIPGPNTILITHNHRDHYDAEALPVIARARGADVITTGELAESIGTNGISAVALEPGEQTRRGPFTIDAVDAPHDELPVPVPQNLAFLINDRILHPGDSLWPMSEQVEILFLPVAAPWLRAVDAVQFALRLKPRLVIPIHDAALKDFSLETLYGRLIGGPLEQAGITFKPLTPDESVIVE